MERTMTRPWWIGVPAAEATLACGEETHRLVWEEGILTAPDHVDPDGERALAALGGEPLACVAMLDAWRDHAEDPDVLLLGSRGPADLIAIPEETPHQLGLARPRRPSPRSGAGFGQVVMVASSALGAPAPEPDGAKTLARLLSLGGGLSRRLDATVAAHWRARLLTPDTETERLQARLHAALYGRLLATLIGWLGRTDIALQLELASEAAPPSLRRAADGSLLATISFGWLVEVWARGLEIVWGRLCLAATTTDGLEWELQTIGPDLDEPTTLIITVSS
jgi:hypothetical protein